ncbi:MAG TPA: Spy/CpxP family protein refolding chaperone [Rhizomicrobium sp.]|nr:Spy/CpxP family protein refolding chaperone [Rhizomicrobium sp.]
MRKALLPALASLLICGTATAALIANNAHADQSNRRPVMLTVAQNPVAAAEPEAGPPPPGMEHAIMMRQPGQFCQDIYAHKAGEMAFLEAKLQLNASQQPLFARWKGVSLDIAKRHEGDCSGRVQKVRAAGQRPDMMQRLDREEDMLKTRLADIQAERPALEALYGALNAAQKQEFARAAGYGMGERMHMAMAMIRHAPQMGRRLDRGGPDGAPPMPPPPPQ